MHQKALCLETSLSLSLFCVTRRILSPVETSNTNDYMRYIAFLEHLWGQERRQLKQQYTKVICCKSEMNEQWIILKVSHFYEIIIIFLPLHNTIKSWLNLFIHHTGNNNTENCTDPYQKHSIKLMRNSDILYDALCSVTVLYVTLASSYL
jgi:hypothetical protein